MMMMMTMTLLHKIRLSEIHYTSAFSTSSHASGVYATRQHMNHHLLLIIESLSNTLQTILDLNEIVYDTTTSCESCDIYQL